MPDAPIFTLAGRRVWVMGHRGMVGSAVVRRLAEERCTVVTAGREEGDLRSRDDVDRLMTRLKPDVVVVAAATVGGIAANSARPASFLYDNLMIESNAIDAAAKFDVERLIFLGSSCIYPREAPQPIPESALLTGPLEPTNEWYAIAKIAGIKLCQAYRRQYGCSFISAMPCNLYGPNDNFDLEGSHVIPGLMAKLKIAMEERASSLEIWGSGLPRREFLHVDDLADAVVHLLLHYDGEETINVGTGSDIEIRELAALLCDVAGFGGALAYDASRPDGTLRKRLDVSRLSDLGWTPSIGLREGLKETWAWYLDSCASRTVRAPSHA